MDRIPIARPFIGEQEEAAVAEVLRSGWVTQGPKVAAFEEAFARFVGAPHACAVSSGTTALHLALLVAGVGAGDEVITVSHSFIATANVVRHLGAVPVFVDIQPDSFNMDPALVRPAITRRTRAILCVHQLGMPADMAAINAVAEEHGIPVVEDAACAAGSELRLAERWERIGRPHGRAACFSFHPRKVLTTGDGGMITTADAEWDRRFRLLRAHAQTVPAHARQGKVVSAEYPVLGYNFRLTDIQAAVGLCQLERLPGMVQRRRELAARYGQLLGGIPGLGLPADNAGTRTNWQSYCLRLPASADQGEVMAALQADGVSTVTGVMCAHREPAYGPDGEPCVYGDLTHSEQAQDRCIMLPLFHTMTEQDQDQVAAALARTLNP